MGTDSMNFVELTQKIGRKTGGISVYPLINDVRGSDEMVAKLMVRTELPRLVVTRSCAFVAL